MDHRLPRTPGWYVSTEDPARLRHWSGWGWDLRTRRRPPWIGGTRTFAARSPDRTAGNTGPVLDGKVDPALLRPPALPVASTPARVHVGRHHPAGLGLDGDATSRAGRSSAGDHDASIRVLASRRVAPRRGPLLASTAVLGVLALLVAALLGTTRSPATEVGAITDSAFAHAANVACAAAVGGIRTPTTVTAATPGSPPGSPPVGAVEAANVRLRTLQARLGALPVGGTDQGRIQAWLVGWSAYAAARLAAARAGASGASATSRSALVSSARADATRADTFALANALGDCVLGGAPTAALRQF